MRHFYTQAMREAHAEQHIAIMSEVGPAAFEATQSKHIGATYGIPPEYVRAIKARFRNELSFGEGK